MWSIACNSQLLSPTMMPPAARPISLNDALETLPRLTDDHAKVRALGALQLLFQAGLPPAQAAKTLQALAGRDLRVASSAAALVIDPLLSLGLVINLALLQQLVMFVVGFETCADLSVPCEKPVATGIYAGIDRLTTLKSELVVKKSVAEVAPLLDPRAWANCGELFKKSYEVVERDGRYVRHDSGVGVGKSWKGLLYEVLAVGPQRSSQVLSIDYEVIKDPRVPRVPKALRLNFSLHESLAYEFGGVELPGLMQMNGGFVHAAPYVDPKDPKKKPDRSRTKIVAVKTVHFGRLSRWSGAGAYDHGEIMNYLAPAFLTLWTDDLRRVVPCCQRTDVS